MISRGKFVVAVLVAALLLSAVPQGIWGGGAAAAENPFAGIKWFRHDPQSPVEQKMNEWRSSRPADAEMLNYIAQEQTVDWIGGWFDDNTMAFYVNNRINDYQSGPGVSRSWPSTTCRIATVAASPRGARRTVLSIAPGSSDSRRRSITGRLSCWSSPMA